MLIAKAAIEIPFENVDFEFYKKLYEYVFVDIYDWAGTIRTVDMSKKGTNFCAAEKINERGQRLFQRLSDLNFLKDIKGDDFIKVGFHSHFFLCPLNWTLFLVELNHRKRAKDSIYLFWTQ